ncbi:hypothetical protein [Loktanella sp. SALINAS62]|uniref:hypothetical protein n=1 Tax=Loktanella sp. SALINAS62 TaxID=2706124 RepID=UPI001B8C4CFD|nr:hypothetical protein [Loktanella sp. SALINAS62]MBS1301185.1 hypothetical protein [Loktanella sp. SALINAS62]
MTPEAGREQMTQQTPVGTVAHAATPKADSNRCTNACPGCTCGNAPDFMKGDGHA